MRKNILILGGTRYFGKLLVQRLLGAGHSVTIATRGRASDPFGERVTRIKVDRSNDHAMQRAFADCAPFDIIYDQVCYNPLDAAIAVRVFAGKVKRYVMASTIEVYRDLLGAQEAPFGEDDWRVQAQAIDTQYPWDQPLHTERCYGPGKRQAEAYLFREGSLPVVSVRMAHVLGGVEDFTGRLAHYVELARQHQPLRYTHAQGATSFIGMHEIADFLVWTGMQTFLGPVNAASDGTLSAQQLFERIGQVLDVGVASQEVTCIASSKRLSPFDYNAPYVLDTARAYDLGYRFSHLNDWLDDTIRRHDLAFA